MKFIGNLAIAVFVIQMGLVGVFFIKPDLFQAAYNFFAPTLATVETAESGTPISAAADMPGDLKTVEIQPKSAEIVIVAPAAGAPAAPQPSAVDQVIQSMRDANIAFNTPKRMAVDESKEIKLLLSLDQETEELIAQLSTEDPNVSAEIKASELMKAKLTGDPKVFEIQSLDDDLPQAVPSTGSTEWRWNVIPRKRVMHDLEFNLFAIIKVDGSEASRKVNTFQSDAIEVVVNVPDFLRGFVVENVWGVLSAVLGPAFIGLLRVFGWVKAKR